MKININSKYQQVNSQSDEEYDVNKIIQLSDWDGKKKDEIEYHNCLTNTDIHEYATEYIADTDQNENFFIIDNFLHDPEIRRSGWVRDDLVNSCEICNLEFSMFRRKHHCRCCGKIFCYECTKYYINVPDLDCPCYLDKNVKERVCSFCYKKIIDFQYLEKMYTILSNLPLELQEINKLSLVSRTWNRVTKYYRANYRKILYKKFTEPFTTSERNFIWINRLLLVSHNNWQLQLIRVIEEYYSNLSNNQISDDIACEISEILNENKKSSCRNLKCPRRCKQQLGTEEAILCLSLPFKKLVCEKYLMKIICSGGIRELLCYLPVLVDILKYRDDSNALSDYLLKISKSDYKFANHLFWEITVQMENKKYEPLYERLRIRLTESLTEESKDCLKNSFYFVENLTQMVTTEDKFATLLQAYFNTLNDTGIYSLISPVNTGVKLIGINKEGIRIRGSSSKPISIPFYTKLGGTCNSNYELLYKKDDVRKDLIIMNIIKLIDIILKRDEGLDLYIISYNILPTSSNTGFIEIVRDAETILGINKRKKFSILNFILEHNPDKSVDEIRERFTKSCVAYCILSYILGIGDRHMENIMVKTSGEIFHIDFGFVMGADPKPMAPEIRITDEMVDAMGGYESKHYAQFKELCARSFLCLRRHVAIFRCMFASFTRANPPIDKKLTNEYIEKFITNKFLVGENVNNAKLYLINKVSTRSMGYSESLIDFCHQAQDSTSVINSSLTNSALNLGSSILGMFWKS